MAKVLANALFAGIGTFFSPNDNTRHALVTTTEGKVFEIFYNTKGKGQSYLACFDAVTTGDAFFTTDDNTSHVVVATPDGNVSEIFYNESGVFFSTPPLATFEGISAISGFFTSDDKTRHVIVATTDGNITEVYYDSEIGSHISSPPLARFANIVAISAFFTPDDTFRHVIVATADGKVTEVYYDSKSGTHISEPPLAVMPNIVDIAAFYTPDDHNRHVIVATSDGKLTEIYYSSTIGVHISQPALTTLPGIVGIGAFFSSDDDYRHVIVATANGDVTEVYYKPATGVFVSSPPLGVFAVVAPAADDISPDLSNLDTNATQRVNAGAVGTAGRTLSICGTAARLFIFNDHSGVWTNTGAPAWTQLPTGPGSSNLFPHSEIASDPSVPGHAVAATLTGAFETTDGGTTWTLALDPSQEPGWNCLSQAIRSVVFSNNSSLVLATDCGVAMRAPGAQTFSFFNTNAQVTALAVSQTKLWARTVSSLFCLVDGSTQWATLLNNSINLPAPNPNDSFSLAAFDNFAYMPSATSGLGGCGGGCVLGIYNVANGKLTSQPVQSKVKGTAAQVCDGTGLGGRKFVRSFISRDQNLANSVGPGGRLQLFFGSAQEIYQAADIDAGGNPSNWNLVITTCESRSKTSSGGAPATHVHADIWDFLIDVSPAGNQAWVAGDGGVYQIQLKTPFTFPESSGWTLFFAGMHTHQAHMVSVVPTNPVNRSCVAYPTGDNEGWYQGSSMRVNPAAKWGVTNTPDGNLGDVNWTIADASASRFMFLVRNQETAALVDLSNLQNEVKFVSFLDFWKKKNGTDLELATGHFFPSGPTALQFIPSPKSAGGFSTLDAVMMCDLPLITYDETTDTNNPMFPASNPLGQSTNGQPVLIRNHNFEINADINMSKGAGWAVEVNAMPANAQGFYVTGSRAAPIYFCFTSSGDLLQFTGAKWNSVTSGLTSSAEFGPAFVNPFDSQVIFAITPAAITWSNNGGTNFNPDHALSELVAGGKNLPMNSIAQMAFNFDNPAEIVAGGAAGIFYRNAAGRWSDLTHLLPTPFFALTGVAIDSEALYASFDSRSITRITSYRNS